MFEVIRHPISNIRFVRYIVQKLTPEILEELRNAKTDEEKMEIEERFLRKIFPELA